MCKCRADSHLQGSMMFWYFVTASRPRCPSFEKHWTLLFNSVYSSIYTRHLWGSCFICFKSPFPTFSGKELSWQCRRHRSCGYSTSVGKIPWKKKNGNPTTAFLPGKSHGQRNLVGQSPWGYKRHDWVAKQIPNIYCVLSTHRDVSYSSSCSSLISSRCSLSKKLFSALWFFAMSV